ncbi:MAG: MFS transporter [Spirochaetales bacterium]|nr:MFS transporter [Leptospiraceae bacterium]MCP5481099.1 MFS transporter [Spirochaetales bacterium]
MPNDVRRIGHAYRAYLPIALIFFSMVPALVIVPVLKDLIKDRLHGTNDAVAYFISVAQLAAFLGAPLAGFLSDRLRNRRTLVALFALINAVCFFAFTLLDSIEALLFLRFVEGGVSIFVIGLLMASVTDFEHEPGQSHRGRLVGLAGTMLALGAAVGLVAGRLGNRDPLLPFCAASAMMAMVGICALVFLRDGPFHKTESLQLGRVLQAFQERPQLLLPFVYTFVDRFTVGFLISSFNIHLRETIGLPAGQVGLFLATVLGPMALLSLPVVLLVRRTGPILPVFLGSLLYGSAIAAAGLLSQPLEIYLAVLFAGLGAGIMFVPSILLAARLAPPDLRGTVMSAFMGAGALGFMLGPLTSVALEHNLRYLVRPDLLFGTLALIFGMLEVLMILFSVPFVGSLRRALGGPSIGTESLPGKFE